MFNISLFLVFLAGHQAFHKKKEKKRKEKKVALKKKKKKKKKVSSLIDLFANLCNKDETFFLWYFPFSNHFPQRKFISLNLNVIRHFSFVKFQGTVFLYIWKAG